MTDQKKGVISSRDIPCGYCGHTNSFEILASFSSVKTHEDEYNGMAIEINLGDVYEIVLCPKCGKVNVIKWFYQDDFEPRNFELLFPPKRNVPEGTPPSVAKEYVEALKQRVFSPNAYGIMVGRMLEALCADRGAKGKNLKECIEDLASKSVIPQQLADMADYLREFRNIGGHYERGDLTEAEVPYLEAISAALLEYVYGAPNLLQQVKVRLQELEEKAPKDGN
jgi:hypothetical protein